MAKVVSATKQEIANVIQSQNDEAERRLGQT